MTSGSTRVIYRLIDQTNIAQAAMTSLDKKIELLAGKPRLVTEELLCVEGHEK